MKKLYGVIVAMTTPFTAEGEVDVPALRRAVDFQIEKGVNCLYPCGTTGEMYLMTKAQRKLVAETVVRQAAGRVTVFIHCGAMDPDEVVELSLHAHEIGADGVGIVTLLFVNLVFVIMAWLFESSKLLSDNCSKYIKYDNVALIAPNRRDELKADLEKRTGLKIERIEVGMIDYLKDAVLIRIFYDEESDRGNSIAEVTKMPR